MRTRSNVPRTTDPLDWVEKKQDPPGTVVRFVSHEIGKGVFAEKNFNKGEFLFEYDGQLKPADDTVEDDQTFIFHFKCDGKNLYYSCVLTCVEVLIVTFANPLHILMNMLIGEKTWILCSIDATASKRNGRFANDEWRNPNAYVKKASLLEIPKLLIFARRNIITGEEIRFDYGQKDATWRYKVASEGMATSNEGSQNLIDQSEVQSALPEQKEEEEEYVPDLPQEEDEEDAASMFGAGHSEKKSRKRKFTVRHTWTPDELQEIHRYFSIYFKKQKTPGEAAIRRAMKKSQEDGGTLWQLPLTSIKSKVSWLRLQRK
ncbi:hypothetical protein BSL78_14268 [Apostichopus japonicus]|uniref:SET domain-containing protein n=1 Tax=Stichopus japonicus TaxID=307972 RepID=A0A2G8KLI0_STIJA|nr:hypothetical protein BSL78_14268 [Apostichopus japonicus]